MFRMSEQVNQTLQRGLVPVYALGVAIGVAQLLFATPSMLEQIGHTGADALGLLMLVGASLCLGGTVIPRGTRGDWFGEYAGLWGIVASIVTWAGVVFSTVGDEPSRVAPGLALLMLAALLVVRWLRVRHDAQTATGKDGPPPPTLAD